MRSIVFGSLGLALAQGALAQVETDEDMIILAHERLDPIYVYGDRTDGDPGSVSYLSAGDIESVAADHPAEALNLLPGVNIHINSGQEHLIAIRSPVLTGGAGQGSFLILENGVPTRAPAFGNVNALLEPHHEVASTLEVVRGPGSAQYGSNAVHGLINVIQPLGPFSDGGSVHASYSSLNRYKTDLVATSAAGWRAALSLQDEVGWRDNTGLGQQKLTVNGDFELGAWTVQPFFSFSNLNQETAGFIEGPDAYEDEDIAGSNPNPEAFRDASSARAHLRFIRDFAGGELTVTPFLRTQEMEFRQHFLPYKGFEENGHDSGGVMFRFDPDESGNVDFRFGADIELATGYLIETQPEPFGFFPGDSRFPVGSHYDYDVDTTSFAAWGEAHWQMSERLSLLAGLRAETHEYDYTTNIPAGINGRFNVPDNRSDSFDLLTPKLGLLWQGDMADYYINYARGERAPQASDLYRLQSLQVPGEVEAETLDSLEIGVRGEFAGQFVYDVAAYVMEKDNFFFRDSDGLNVPFGSTAHTGVEAAFTWEAAPDLLRFVGQVSWSDQTYTFDRVTGSASNSIQDGDQIDTAPEWLADLDLIWTPISRFEGRLGLEYVGEYFTNPGNSQDYPGHTVFNARASYDVTDTLQAYVIVRNLTDERYADRADFAFGDERYFPGEPLNATVGIRAQFN